MAQASPIQKDVYFSDFLFDFRTNPATQDLARVTNEQSVLSSIRKILKTNHFEIPYNPYFGANISHYLFENFDQFTEIAMTEDIRFAITNYEPRVEILDIVVNGSPDTNSIDITVTVSIINNPAPLTLTTTLTRVR
jgi:phage baseplate assembly protein W